MRTRSWPKSFQEETSGASAKLCSQFDKEADGRIVSAARRTCSTASSSTATGRTFSCATSRSPSSSASSTTVTVCARPASSVSLALALQSASAEADIVTAVRGSQGEDGWFKPTRYTLIREILRRKFNHLLASGTPLPAGSCDELKAAAELEQQRADGLAVDVDGIETKSEEESDPGWVEEGRSASEDEVGGGKGKEKAGGKVKAPRKAKRKTLNALIHPSTGAKSRKAVGRTRARQVGVTDAVEMVRPSGPLATSAVRSSADPIESLLLSQAERLQRDIEREARLTANGVI